MKGQAKFIVDRVPIGLVVGVRNPKPKVVGTEPIHARAFPDGKDQDHHQGWRRCTSSISRQITMENETPPACQPVRFRGEAEYICHRGSFTPADKITLSIL